MGDFPNTSIDESEKAPHKRLYSAQTEEHTSMCDLRPIISALRPIIPARAAYRNSNFKKQQFVAKKI